MRLPLILLLTLTVLSTVSAFRWDWFRRQKHEMLWLNVVNNAFVVNEPTAVVCSDQLYVYHILWSILR